MRAPKAEITIQSFTLASIPPYLSLPANMENPYPLITWQSFCIYCVVYHLKAYRWLQTLNHCHVFPDNILREGIHSRTVPQVLFGVELQDQSWLCTMAGRRAPFQGPDKLHHRTCKCPSRNLLQSLHCPAAPALQVEPAELHFSAVQTGRGKLIKPLPEGRMHRKASETTGTADSEAAAIVKTKTK